VVHGEEDQSVAFAETLRSILPGSDVTVPHQGDTLSF